MNYTIIRTTGNTRELVCDDYILLVSYESPVAFYDIGLNRVSRTIVRFSRATERHIVDFVHSKTGSYACEQLPQAEMDLALSTLTGDIRLKESEHRLERGYIDGSHRPKDIRAVSGALYSELDITKYVVTTRTKKREEL